MVSPSISKQMKSDWQEYSAEKAGSRWTIALSTIGAIALGVSVLSFIGANWEDLSRFEKILMAFLATFGSLGGGYYLREI